MSEKAQLVVDAASAAAIAKVTTYSGVCISLAAWFNSLNAWVPLLSLTLAAATFAVNWYYKRQENKRADEIHRQKLGVKNEND